MSRPREQRRLLHPEREKAESRGCRLAVESSSFETLPRCFYAGERPNSAAAVALRSSGRTAGWSVLLGRAPRNLRGAPPVASVDAGRPLRGRMSQQRDAVVLQIRWPLDLQRVLDLGWLQHR